jgi:hypothetical protein
LAYHGSDDKIVIHLPFSHDAVFTSNASKHAEHHGSKSNPSGNGHNWSFIVTRNYVYHSDVNDEQLLLKGRKRSYSFVAGTSFFHIRSPNLSIG